ncbi:aminotransferase AlaT [Alcanivorax sp. S71-1-4]|jgi:alanine-synthesizing transaminase|uniref:Glutamate-pyruvate aminotransferase AlaA n=1 Tax=Isoalcanivorax pacificus W11-5 TaxID=391936 RepID=A0A0B4XNQ6_9GAMM|nr:MULTISPECIES: pyridoxal phosphate-dependent aminotransferase [Alcanivoracaceae]AJD47922.1 aminotransferase AlaT [Isoalcanivorax pacificus W11-5]KAF0807487.1 aminotransferase AlaT [Alcanivorax sp. S71-1-4]
MSADKPAILKSEKLKGVCYDIRGPVLREANRMEEDGQRIIKLNIGNPAPFGLIAPDEILQDVIHNLPDSTGYCHSKGLFPARKAVMHYCQEKGIEGVTIDDIILGNGVSELIVMSMQALVNNGDEILIPAPDYPLWTAAVRLAGGNPVHYLCDEQQDWQPALDDIRAKITPRTRALVIINPNNPTGANYSRAFLQEMLEIARQHNLIVFADEIYDKILYDEEQHVSIASMAEDLLFVTFNGLSKAYRAAGFRSGWMIISGAKHLAKDFIEGLEMLASMRLCANVPAQHAIQTALGGYQSIDDLVLPSGRLGKQRDLAWQLLNEIPGVSCVKPKSALYLFPRLDPDVYRIDDDEAFALDLLRQERVLIVQGTAFNWPKPDHFRIVFLPQLDDIQEAISRIGRYLARMRK